MVHAALPLLMLEAIPTDLVFTISLKRSTLNLQLSTSWPADYPIFSPDSRHIAAPPPKAADQVRARPRAPSTPAARRPRSTSFITAADGHGGTLITEAAQTANQLVPLTTPHTG
jgi:hypothetical protein